MNISIVYLTFTRVYDIISSLNILVTGGQNQPYCLSTGTQTS